MNVKKNTLLQSSLIVQSWLNQIEWGARLDMAQSSTTSSGGQLHGLGRDLADKEGVEMMLGPCPTLRMTSPSAYSPWRPGQILSNMEIQTEWPKALKKEEWLDGQHTTSNRGTSWTSEASIIVNHAFLTFSKNSSPKKLNGPKNSTIF